MCGGPVESGPGHVGGRVPPGPAHRGGAGAPAAAPAAAAQPVVKNEPPIGGHGDPVDAPVVRKKRGRAFPVPVAGGRTVKRVKGQNTDV